jgi:hypothetical protein
VKSGRKMVLLAIATGLFAGTATPVAAQSDDDGTSGNHVTVGLGVAAFPRYVGADAYAIEPVFGVQERWLGSNGRS